MGISIGSVETIMHDKLGLLNVCARWVPKMLSVVNSADRVDISRANLYLFNDDPEGFCLRVVTEDETFFHHYDPETKQKSKRWKHRDSTPPINFRDKASAGKVMATIFWDAKKVIHIFL